MFVLNFNKFKLQGYNFHSFRSKLQSNFEKSLTFIHYSSSHKV